MGDSQRPGALPSHLMHSSAHQPASAALLLCLACHHKALLLLRHRHHHSNDLPLLGATDRGQEAGNVGALLFLLLSWTMMPVMMAAFGPAELWHVQKHPVDLKPMSMAPAQREPLGVSQGLVPDRSCSMASPASPCTWPLLQRSIQWLPLCWCCTRQLRAFREYHSRAHCRPDGCRDCCCQCQFNLQPVHWSPPRHSKCGVGRPVHTRV
uniref:Uncharacterized protein n=1 Tax=Sphaerodactylus townsendi TaxID=933632 RepID=A0ACB8F347_9SAUR